MPAKTQGLNNKKITTNDGSKKKIVLEQDTEDIKAPSDIKTYDATLHDRYGENWDEDGVNDEVVNDDEWDDDNENDVENEDDVVEVDDTIVGDVGADGDGDDDCAFDGGRRGKTKKLGMIDREDDDGDGDSDNDNDDIGEASANLVLDVAEYRTVNYLTKYEKAALLGARTTQIAQGAKPMIIGVEKLRPKTIAQLELESGMMPLYIFRPLPNGKQERMMIKDLKLKKTDIVYDFNGGDVDIDMVQKIDQLIQQGGDVLKFRELIKNNRVNKSKNT
jgi:DNA-directed RNA polymerase subunit K/omega